MASSCSSITFKIQYSTNDIQDFCQVPTSRPVEYEFDIYDLLLTSRKARLQVYYATFDMRIKAGATSFLHHNLLTFPIAIRPSTNDEDFREELAFQMAELPLF